MKLLRESSIFPAHSVVTIGNFDGVHKGHQRLIETVVQAARAFQIPSVLLTFEPHPQEFFMPDKPVARLMRFFEKWTVIEKHGVDYFYVMRFTKKMAALSPEAFVKNILVQQLNAKKIIVGDDFCFGAKRAGDVALLKTLGKKYGFEVDALPQWTHDNHRISSTRLRNALKIGDFNEFTTLTGRPFYLTGKVSYGDQVGRQLGYPTANIYLHRKQVPLMGIFIVCVHELKKHALSGVASLGFRPTLDGKTLLLEVHLFDFDEEIYGKRITVELIKKIRDEVRFDNTNDLIAQIDSDAAIARRYFEAR